MNAPHWLNSIITDFGAGIGVRTLLLNGKDAAAIKFEDGKSLHFEYIFESLAMTMHIPVYGSSETLKRLLSYSAPERKTIAKVRTAYLKDLSKALITITIPERQVTVPLMNTVFTELWRLSEDFRRRIL